MDAPLDHFPLFWKLPALKADDAAPGRAPALLPTPTAEQSAWQDLELGSPAHSASPPSRLDSTDERGFLRPGLTGALFQYNIGEYGTEKSDYACGNMSTPMPPPSAFNPQRLNATAWMESVKAFGGKYAVLTVQAGCGAHVTHCHGNRLLSRLVDAERVDLPMS